MTLTTSKIAKTTRPTTTTGRSSSGGFFRRTVIVLVGGLTLFAVASCLVVQAAYTTTTTAPVVIRTGRHPPSLPTTTTTKESKRTAVDGSRRDDGFSLDAPALESSQTTRTTTTTTTSTTSNAAAITAACTTTRPTFTRRSLLVSSVSLLSSAPVLLGGDESSSSTTTTSWSNVANAFEGGIGGLGKTKPITGVQYVSDLSAPYQDLSTGETSAELLLQRYQPALVSFRSPWPLLSTSNGYETRDPRYPESAFIQVVDQDDVPDIDLSSSKSTSTSSLSKRQMQEVLLQTVMSQQGKFGAYAAPIDVKVKQAPPSNPNDDGGNTFLVSFTTYTPGLRESERQALIKYVPVSVATPTPTTTSTSLVMLITGTTSARFQKQLPTFQGILQSFRVVPTPPRTGSEWIR